MPRYSERQSVLTQFEGFCVTRKGQESDILQTFHGVEDIIREVRKQSIYRNWLKNTCLWQSHCNREFPIVLNFDSAFEVNDVTSFDASGWHRTSSRSLTVFTFYRDPANMSQGVEFEKQQMFIRNIEVVDSPNYLVVTSLKRLYDRDNAIEQRFASGVYFNSVKSSFELLSSSPNREFGGIRKFVGKVPANRAVPCKIQGGVQVVDSVSGYQRQIKQSLFEIWKLVYKRLHAGLWVVLDSDSVSCFPRDSSGVEILDMFLGPLNFQSGVSKQYAHGEEIITRDDRKAIRTRLMSHPAKQRNFGQNENGSLPGHQPLAKFNDAVCRASISNFV